VIALFDRLLTTLFPPIACGSPTRQQQYLPFPISPTIPLHFFARNAIVNFSEVSKTRDDVVLQAAGWGDKRAEPFLAARRGNPRSTLSIKATEKIKIFFFMRIPRLIPIGIFSVKNFTIQFPKNHSFKCRITIRISLSVRDSLLIMNATFGLAIIMVCEIVFVCIFLICPNSTPL